MKRILACILVAIMMLPLFASCDLTEGPNGSKQSIVCEHKDDNTDHECDVCEKNVGTHSDASGDGDHLCEYCGKSASNCVDSDKNHHCDECNTKITSCNDSDKDHDCDECGANVGAHADSANDGNHNCDYCGEKIGDCADSNTDHECDECGTNVGAHADSANDGNHTCDYCGATITSCKDADKDHDCDDCGANMGTHADRADDGNHLCEYCGKTASSCNDADKDHDCDDCGANMGTHADSANDGNHSCDYCGEKIGDCRDSNTDGKCDECGAAVGTGGTVSGGTYTREGKTIYFGSYPQTEVLDSSLKSTLTARAGTLPTSSASGAWTSYGYYISGSVENFMWYIDITEGGEKYRGVYFTSYRPYYTTTSSSTGNTYQDDNGYTTGNVYWFKWEPISWTILSENTSNGTALILCDMIIDSQEYYINTSNRAIDGKTVYANNYAHSTIRKWLNETFYNTAFSELQKEIILTTTVDNSVASTGYNSNQYACENTNDKIFLLSAQEGTNTAYGFASSTSTFDTARRKKTTDYAQSQGAYTSTNSSYAGNGWWWLRSPNCDYSSMARVVCYDGYVSSDYVRNSSRGVVPALQIRL